MVVFIIGVILGFATLNLSGRALDDTAQEEALRLVEILRLARDDAGFTGLELGWRKTEKGYQFLALSDQGWTPYGGRSPLRERTLPQPLELRVKVDDLPIETDKSEPLPQLMLLSSGEVTPFSIELGAKQLDSVFVITGNLLGKLTLERVSRDDLVFRES